MKNFLQPKQALKDFCRRKNYAGPVFYLTHEKKIDLHKYYTIQVTVSNKVVGEATALSRRLAEIKAAFSAIEFISQTDSSILNNVQLDKYGRATFGRSYSVDQISKANRFDSFSSIIPAHLSSASPSIVAFDSITVNSEYYLENENKDSYVESSTSQNTRKSLDTHGEGDEETLSDSLDEGVCLNSETSSSTPTGNSPTTSIPPKLHSDTTDNHPSKTKEKSHFLSSFSLLNSLRAISRRSSKRKQVQSEVNSKAEYTCEEASSSQYARPTSSSSSASSTSSTSSAFSSSSSITSSTQSSSTSGSFTLDESYKANEENVLSNGFAPLITESIIEEEEEECDHHDSSSTAIESERNQLGNESSLNSSSVRKHSNLVRTLPRSLSNGNVLGASCSHNHFSIYGTLLCASSSSSTKNLTIEATPTASLLRYCVLMYFPLPYYDIRFDNKYFVTCRILLTPSPPSSKNHASRSPRPLPNEYKDKEFTARGNGETLRTARIMAAQCIIDKLKHANIYFEE